MKVKIETNNLVKLKKFQIKYKKDHDENISIERLVNIFIEEELKGEGVEK